MELEFEVGNGECLSNRLAMVLRHQSRPPSAVLSSAI